MSGSSNRVRAVLVLLLLAGLAMLPAPARAQCSDCECEIQADDDIQSYYAQETGVTTAHILIEFTSTETWLVYLFQAYVLPSLMGMAEQATTTAMMQTLIFGTYLDAQQQLEVQGTLQELVARAHKDYQPDDDMCMFGTFTRSLGATMFRGETNGYILSEFGEGRRVGAAGTEAAQGPLSDRMSRLRQLRTRYCTPNDNSNALSTLCFATDNATTENRDVDYSGVMERSQSLTIDTADQTDGTHPTDDERDVLALASNIYANDVPWRLPEWTFGKPTAQQTLLDIRSINAERAVAEASFYSIVGMKSEGTPESDGNSSSADVAGYMNVIMKQLGVPTDTSDPDSKLFLGPRPSYDAQMQMLTKGIFQDARFYTNLYDTPANVERKRVAMQAIGLIQDFDTLQSNLRTEMILSQTLELELIKLQHDVVNKVTSVTGEAPHI